MGHDTGHKALMPCVTDEENNSELQGADIDTIDVGDPDRRVATDSSEEDVEERKLGPQQSLLRYRVRLNHRRKPSDPQRADGEQRLQTGESEQDELNSTSRPWHTRGRGDASVDDLSLIHI